MRRQGMSARVAAAPDSNRAQYQVACQGDLPDSEASLEVLNLAPIRTAEFTTRESFAPEGSRVSRKGYGAGYIREQGRFASRAQAISARESLPCAWARRGPADEHARLRQSALRPLVADLGWADQPQALLLRG